MHKSLIFFVLQLFSQALNEFIKMTTLFSLCNISNKCNSASLQVSFCCFLTNMFEETSPTFQINKPSEGKPSPLPLSIQPLTLRIRQKYRMRNSDRQSMRYQCICSLQYFCYSSLYQHLKKHHKDFIVNNRHFSANNMIQTVDAKYGFKIRKVLMEKIQFRSMQDMKRQQIRGQQLRKIRLNQKEISQKLKIEFTQKAAMARQRLSEINLQNEEIDRKIKITKQKISKSKQIAHQMNQILYQYEKILSILNIRVIAKFVQKQQREHSGSFYS